MKHMLISARVYSSKLATPQQDQDSDNDFKQVPLSSAYKKMMSVTINNQDFHSGQYMC